MTSAEKGECMYTVTYKCDASHDSTYCVCQCHNQTKEKRYLPCEIRQDENGEIYKGLIDTSPSSSSSDEDAYVDISTPDKIATIREAIRKYPLASRPCFEARRSREIPRTPAVSLQVPLTVLDDFYLNLLDWGQSNLIALATGSHIQFFSPSSDALEYDWRIGYPEPPRAPESSDMDDEPLLSANRTSLISQASSTRRGAQASPSVESGLTAVRWSPKASEIAVGTRHGVVEIWDAEKGLPKSSHRGHSHRVGTLDWVPDQPNLITSGSRDKLIVTHDTRSPQPVEQRHDRHKQEVCGLRWRPTHFESPPVTPKGDRDEQSMEEEPVFKNVQEILDWDLQQVTSLPPFSTSEIRKKTTNALTSALEGDETPARCMLRSGVSVLASGGNDNKVFIWELGYTIPLIRLSVHTAAVKALSWAPMAGGILATGGGTNDRTIRLWDVSKGRQIGSCETESQVCNLFWSPATLELISSHGYTLNQLNVWDLKHRAQEGSAKSLLLKKVATLAGHTSRVLYMAGSPDGKRVATATGDAEVKLWNAFL